MEKKPPDNEDRKISKIQLLLCFLIFLIMLGVMVAIAYSPHPSILATIFISLVCLLFAFLIKEPISSRGIMKSIDIGISKLFHFTLNRENEKQPYEMDYQTPREDRPPTTPENHELLDEGNKQLNAGNIEIAYLSFRKVIKNAPNYWLAHVNEQHCLMRTGKIDEAIAKSNYIINRCKDNKFLAQIYINIGDCVLIKSTSQSDTKLEEDGYMYYEMAYDKDPTSIYSLYYFWVAKVTRDPQHAPFFAQLIENHKDYDLLCKHEGLLKYFKKYKKTNKPITEKIIMNWKKLLLTSTFTTIVFINIAALLISGVVNGLN